MPIGGFVVQTDLIFRENCLKKLKQIEQIDIYGINDKGDVVIVIDAQDSKEMEKIIDNIYQINGVSSVLMAYINIEDETIKNGLF